MSAERFATISKEKLREIRGHVTVKFSPKISSIRTRCVRETSSLCPKPFGRPKAISIHLSPWTLPLLSTPSTWDFGHRLVLSHFAIIASHFIGDFGRSLLPSPRQFSVKSAPNLEPRRRLAIIIIPSRKFRQIDDRSRKIPSNFSQNFREIGPVASMEPSKEESKPETDSHQPEYG